MVNAFTLFMCIFSIVMLFVLRKVAQTSNQVKTVVGDVEKRQTAYLITAVNLIAAVALVVLIMVHPSTKILLIGIMLIALIIYAITFSHIAGIKPRAKGVRENIRLLDPSQKAMFLSALIFVAVVLGSICFCIPGIIADVIKTMKFMGL